MLRPRIIPCLLIRNKGLVKTVEFQGGKYVGDPLNAVRIFNEKKVDELMVLDIDATSKGLEPDYETIAKLAAECRMPFCYGGGIKSAEQARRIIGLGVEKVALSSAAVKNAAIVGQISVELGSQSVAVVIDIKKKRFGKSYEIWTSNGSQNTKVCPVEFSRELERRGVGEIVVNSITRDGTMNGYDLDILKLVRREVSVPITALGGAGKLSDLKSLIGALGVVGAAAGSLFVFKGAYRAVLINYPDQSDKDFVFDTAS